MTNRPTVLGPTVLGAQDPDLKNSPVAWEGDE